MKKLHPLQGLDDRAFDNEFRNLSLVKHQNVVRLIGYCSESRDKYVDIKGKLVRAKTIDRVLCFEYMQGGSLEKHIAGMLVLCTAVLIMYILRQWFCRSIYVFSPISCCRQRSL